MTWSRPSREQLEQKRAERKQVNIAALLLPPNTLHKGVMAANDAVKPAPKTKAARCPALLEMAERKPCLLQVKDVCNGRTDTTVACHSNQAIHGKAGARKADDCYTVWGCVACHAWLDQGKAMASHKEAVFRQAHARQVECWKLIASIREPERFRKAAQWALEQLNVEQR